MELSDRERLFATPGARHAAAVAFGGILVALAFTGAPVTAQDGRAERSAPDEPRDCLNLNEIDHTSVVDDNTILFYGRGREVYRNHLPRSCPDLRTERRFLYRVAVSQLCSTDTITVLQDMGFGFRPGPTCGLGKFAPISEDEAGDLEHRSQNRGERR